MHLLAVVLAVLSIQSPSGVAEKARAWRVRNEQTVIRDLTQFLTIPNVASDLPNIEKNAQAIIDMFKARGVSARTLRIEGVPPLVVADVAPASAGGSPAKAGGSPAKAGATLQTIAFYAHYDGQPVDPSQWDTPPWQPAMKPAGPLTGESRIYARAASDDKAPIIAMLAALDALRSAGIAPKVNVKFVFEGEEEAGSPHLDRYMKEFASDLAVDAWLICDGPVHQSRRPLVYFGARGVVDLQVTVYGPTRALHSGHYGNWAPNPIVMLSHVVASMRDTEGRILIDGFYNDVTPVTAVEREALARVPPFDDEIRRELSLGRTEGSGRSLNEQILMPALNLRGISGGRTGAITSNSIPTEATASIDFRLVPAQTPEGVRARVEEHLTKQGFFIVRDAPDKETLLAHPRVVRVAWGPGYPAARTGMDLPISKRIVEIVGGAMGTTPVTLPTLGGSVPMYLFASGGIPVIGVPIVNHDNNQHAANENLRIQNLWDGIEIYAALLAGL